MIEIFPIMHTLRRLRSAFAALALVALAACAQPARQAEMTALPAAGEAPLATRAPGLANAIVLGAVTGGRETDPKGISLIDNRSFKGALEASLAGHGLTAPTPAAARYQLSSGLMSLAVRHRSYNVTATVRIAWRLVQIGSGRTMWEETLAVPVDGDLSTAVIGADRQRITVEGAGRANIAAMLARLASLPEAAPPAPPPAPVTPAPRARGSARPTS